MARYPLLRLRHRQEQAQPMTEVNVIPVIDISLVLLVILFVTAPLMSTPNLAVSLPRSGAPESAEASVAVTLTAEGRLAVASQEVAWDAAPAALRAALARRPSATVLLRLDKAVPYRSAQRLLAAAKGAGAAKIAIETEPRP